MSDTETERAEHAEDQERFKLALAVFINLDFSRFLNRMERALDRAPFFNPTAYLQKGKDLQVDIEAARIIDNAAKDLRKLYNLPPVEVFVAIGGQDYAAAKEAVAQEKIG